MPGIFDKARLREILEHLDLNQAQAIFRAKNAHHNERQEEALKSAESCSIARLPVTSSTELCWHSGVGTVDGFEDVFFVAPDGTEFDLNRLLQMLPKGRPLRPADVCSHGQRAKRRRVAEVSQQRPKVAMGCAFSRICFAAVCLESGLASHPDPAENDGCAEAEVR